MTIIIIWNSHFELLMAFEALIFDWNTSNHKIVNIIYIG